MKHASSESVTPARDWARTQTWYLWIRAQVLYHRAKSPQNILKDTLNFLDIVITI